MTDNNNNTMLSSQQQQAIIMEQVAMYMSALPCPPMPLVVRQEIDEDEDRECYKNSHDLIATLLIGVMSSHSHETNLQKLDTLNKQRKEKQIQLTETLLNKLQISEGNPEKVYAACQEFTAGYVCAFMNLEVSVSFMPLDYVMRGDSVHKATCSWHRAQEIILAGGASAGKEKVNMIMKTDFSHLSYSELLGLHCERFIRNQNNENIHEKKIHNPSNGEEDGIKVSCDISESKKDEVVQSENDDEDKSTIE